MSANMSSHSMEKARPNVTDPGRVIAHRGASRVAPENTLSAFREAARQGVRWVEFDVSLLGDSTPVVHHDDTLDRCTSRTGALAAINAADLGGIEAGVAHGDAYRGEPLPTLSQALDQLDAQRFYANLEMKPHDGDSAEIAAIVAAHLRERPWARHRVITSSFDIPALEALRAEMSDAPLAVLYVAPPEDWRATLERLDAAAVHLDYAALTQSLLVEARSFGFDVRVYTINEPHLMERFRDQGLTSVITDHPPLFLDLPEWAAWART